MWYVCGYACGDVCSARAGVTACGVRTRTVCTEDIHTGEAVLVSAVRVAALESVEMKTVCVCECAARAHLHHQWCQHHCIVSC